MSKGRFEDLEELLDRLSQAGVEEEEATRERSLHDEAFYSWDTNEILYPSDDYHNFLIQLSPARRAHRKTTDVPWPSNRGHALHIGILDVATRTAYLPTKGQLIREASRIVPDEYRPNDDYLQAASMAHENMTEVLKDAGFRILCYFDPEVL
jgi:hypothetical protein